MIAGSLARVLFFLTLVLYSLKSLFWVGMGWDTLVGQEETVVLLLLQGFVIFPPSCLDGMGWDGRKILVFAIGFPEAMRVDVDVDSVLARLTMGR